MFREPGERARIAAALLVERRLEDWRKGTALASVREAEALARLPRAEAERWRVFWSEVTGFRRMVQACLPD